MRRRVYVRSSCLSDNLDRLTVWCVQAFRRRTSVEAMVLPLLSVHTGIPTSQKVTFAPLDAVSFHFGWPAPRSFVSFAQAGDSGRCAGRLAAASQPTATRPAAECLIVQRAVQPRLEKQSGSFSPSHKKVLLVAC